MLCIQELSRLVLSEITEALLQGAATTCYVTLSPQIVGVIGKYFADRNETHCSSMANDVTLAWKLLNQSRALVNKRLLTLPLGTKT
ncbi:hypothetical protein ACP275_07G080600 [Erythranthe tilingii]